MAAAARDPLAPLARAGIVEPGGRGWRLTDTGERRYGWALRELDERCQELEQAGCPWPEWALTLVLLEAKRAAAESEAA